MHKSGPPAVKQLLQVAKAFQVFSQDLAQSSGAGRAVSSEWSLTQQAGLAARCPPGLRQFSALPAPEQVVQDWWEGGFEAASGQQQASTAPAQEHYQLWAQLANLRDQGNLVQADRRVRGKPTLEYPFAPVSAYLEALHGKRNEGQFDDTVLDLWARQVQQELKAGQDAYHAYMEEAKAQTKKGKGSGVSSMRKFLKRWHPQLVAATKKEQKEILDGVAGLDRNIYGPYLMLLTPDVLAAVTLQAALNRFLSGANLDIGFVKLASLYSDVGLAIRQSVVIAQIRNKWYQELHRRKVVTKRLRKAERARKKDGPAPPEELDHLTAVLRTLGEDGPQLDQQWLMDNEAFEDRLKALRYSWAGKKRDSGELQFETLQRQPGAGKGPAGRQWQKFNMLKAMESALEWPQETVFKVGAIMVKLLIDSATFHTHAPTKMDSQSGAAVGESKVFLHERVFGTSFNTGLYALGIMRMDPEIMAQMERSSAAKAALSEVKHMPMLVPPAPWRTPYSGGHVLTPACIMRGHDSHYKDAVLPVEQATYQRMPEAYDALNFLGSIPWRVNKQALAALSAAWAKGGDIGGLIPRTLAPSPMRCRLTMVLRHHPYNLTIQGRFGKDPNFRREMNLHYKQGAEQYALRCDMELKLRVAQAYANEDRFWYPHTIDFRGRSYPMHANLQHLSDDPCRCLLEFADGKPLGPDGLYWLFIHASNLAGIDKVSRAERHKWTAENLSGIMDSADDPFGLTEDGLGKLWTSASSPWQFLAACFEIRDALASGDPESFPSHLPVHQDGTCNGLQHYAALGRDTEGGASVNLTPTDRPQDIYSRVARTVAGRVEEAAGRGNAIASGVQGTIDRKLVKQTVMTSVYGVTFLGAKDQIANRLRERDWSTDDKLITDTAVYLAKITLKALGDMFISSKMIMNWLRETAGAVTNLGEPVAWTNPLGIPISQPYRREAKKEVWTAMQRTNLHLLPRKTHKVHRMRQRNAFPPNFIHSLDASHMMMTALACRDHGLTFAGVHDSYWTHASDVTLMSQLLREQFVKLHSRPLLEELKAELQEQHPDISLPSCPPPVDPHFDLDLVKQSDYFFS